MDSNDKKPLDAAMLAGSMQEAVNKFQDRSLRRQLGRLVSIHRVIEAVRRVDSSAYNPAIVSIGPFHRDNPALAVTEEVKWQYLRDLLARRPENNLQVAVAEVAARVEDIRGSYSEKFPGITDEALVMMMVLDGCFVLELMMKFAEEDWDLIFSGGWWTLPRLRNDLILMENQIPFFVLQILYKATAPRSPSPDSTTNDETTGRSSTPQGPFLHLLHFFYRSHRSPSPDSTTNDETTGRSSTPQGPFLHLLHFFYCSQVPQQSTREVPSSSCWRLQAACNVLRRMRKGVSNAAFQICFVLFSLIVSGLTCDSQGCSPRDDPETPWVIPSATQLHEAGVRFRSKSGDRKKERDSFVYMEFSAADGFFEIPTMALHGGSNSELRNLVAFEQCSFLNPDLGEYFTKEYFSNYCLLMAYLIDTDHDVEILEKEGILVNLLGSRSEVAALFDNIIKGSRLEKNKGYFEELTEEVKKYCKSERHRWRARLMRDYFGTPWAIISVVAAVVLLGLTIAQTFYTVSAYYHPR